MTEWLHFHFPLSCIGEGNGNPLQCSCLENPRDGGAWWAAIYGVTQSWTWLKRLSSSSSLYLTKKSTSLFLENFGVFSVFSERSWVFLKAWSDPYMLSRQFLNFFFESIQSYKTTLQSENKPYKFNNMPSQGFICSCHCWVPIYQENLKLSPDMETIPGGLIWLPGSQFITFSPSPHG